MDNIENEVIPNILKKHYDELINLLNENDSKYLRVEEVAKFLEMKPENIRVAAERNTCPFAFGGRENMQAQRFTKIPKLTFFNWYTRKGAP